MAEGRGRAPGGRVPDSSPSARRDMTSLLPAPESIGAVRVGARVRLAGLVALERKGGAHDHPTEGTVERLLGGGARGMVRVCWHEAGGDIRRLHAAGILEVME